MADPLRAQPGPLRPAPRRLRRPLLAALLALGLLGPGSLAGRAAPAAPAAPSPDTWPVPDLVSDLRTTLKVYYARRATLGTPYYELAPEFEQDKRDARKDPDTLWEFGGPTGTRCHSAVIDVQFVDCTGRRLAATFGRTYAPSGQPAMFDAPRGFYSNLNYAMTAGYYGLYHAFVHDFDADCADPCSPAPGQTPRDSQTYHERMLRAYEAHARDIILKMFRDTRGDAQFQFDITRSAGLMLSNYLRVVEAMEEYRAWTPGSQDRKKALSLVSAMTQRIWWEWVVPQPNGPRTAGFGDIGSRKTYDAALAGNPGLAGRHQFNYGGQVIESLRPAAQDAPGGAWDGFWFDADYTVPGEYYCGYRFPVGSADYLDCFDHAGRQNLGGTKSPFGQFYGPAGCATRGGPYSCGQVNLGSIAEEWLWSYVGARAGLFLLKELAVADPLRHPGGADPDLPAGALGQAEYDAVTDRLGYGVSGWHGADPYHDDNEWTYNQSPGSSVKVRTLSAGRHDAETQEGVYSLGENDPPGNPALKGDTWSVGLQRGEEYPAGMENHMPGPNPLYASLLMTLVMGDRPDQETGRLAPSLYNEIHRNNPEEFLPWVWLTLSSLNRCTGVADPADPSCFALTPTAEVPVVRRVPLDFPAASGSPTLAFDYLWRAKNGLDDTLLPTSVAAPDKTCRGASGGLPWRQVWDRSSNAGAPYLLDEGGFGGFNEQVQILGGLLRVIAARYPLNSVVPELQPDFEKQRTQVLAPWYTESYDRLKRIFQLYRDPVAGYGYIPEVENSACAGRDLATNAPVMLPWQPGTGDTVRATMTRRAMWYAVAALWYWWYDSPWLDVDDTVW
jgi:hypothetical protein